MKKTKIKEKNSDSEVPIVKLVGYTVFPSERVIQTEFETFNKDYGIRYGFYDSIKTEKILESMDLEKKYKMYTHADEHGNMVLDSVKEV